MTTYTAERKRVLRAFGKKLRSERERLGLSQREFAEATGLHRTRSATWSAAGRNRTC